jgi:nitrogen-specific signal transduction histidine kinase
MLKDHLPVREKSPLSKGGAAKRAAADSLSYQSAQGEVHRADAVDPGIAHPRRRRPKGGKERRTAHTAEILEGLAHEIQNNLQSISMGLDLLCLTQADPLESQTVVRGIERISRLLREVREYFSPPETRHSTDNLVAVLEEVAQRVEKEWAHQVGRLRIAPGGPLPPLRLDWRQFRSTVERILVFSCVLLPQNGELEVEARLREIGAQQYVELKVGGPCAPGAGVEEKDVFTPFLRVNGYQVGLSLVLARRICHRHHGKISFHQDNRQQGLFTLLLKTH